MGFLNLFGHGAGHFGLRRLMWEASVDAGPVRTMTWGLAMRALPTKAARRSSGVFAE